MIGTIWKNLLAACRQNREGNEKWIKTRIARRNRADEGCKMEIYADHLGLPTMGIGHLLTQDDPEYNQPVGTVITEERVRQLFRIGYRGDD